jgi:uncharacterized protein YaaW (UPF0174 family)
LLYNHYHLLYFGWRESDNKSVPLAVLAVLKRNADQLQELKQQHIAQKQVGPNAAAPLSAGDAVQPSSSLCNRCLARHLRNDTTQ